MNSKKRWLMAGAATLAALSASVAAAQTPARPPAPKPAPAAAAEEEGAEVEAVVVTGSFLRGTPETATIPVEGYNLEQMRNQGSPSSLDFVKNLSEVGQVFGESNRSAQMGNGQQTINLRSLGAARTVVVFNGRRMNEEYSFSQGRSNNIATIPQCAIGRVEVLKDGGGTTYGADAVGGVVNYITRRNASGIETQASYRYINGSSGGDYNACVTLGKVVDKGNIQGSFGYIHRSILPSIERDFTVVPYLQNQNGYLAVNNPGAYFLTQQPAITGAANALNSPVTPTGSGNLLYPTTNDFQFGSDGRFRDPNCAALGGFAGWTGAGTGGAAPVCYTANSLFQNLVEESDIFQAYIEGNWEFSPKFKVHGEYSLYWLDLPNIPLDVFTAQVQAWPFARDKFGNIDALPGGQSQIIGTATPIFMAPSYNPAVAEFVKSLKNSNNTPILTGTASTATAVGTGALGAWTNPSYASLNSVALPVTNWKPFGLGGGALDGLNDNQDNRSIQHRGTIEFSGDIGKFLGGNWDWDLAVTHGWGNYFLTSPDILVDRLQAALNGFGGANCVGAPGDFGQGNKNPVTLVNGVPTPTVAPGTNGCQFFNPFPSAFPANVITGQSNKSFVGSGTFPGYIAGQGLQNDPELVKWMYTEFEANYPTWLDVVDFVLRGDLDYHLWAADPMQMAVGLQYRERHGVTDTGDIADRTINPCATPGVPVTACPQAQVGSLLFNRGFTTTGTTQDYDRRYPVESAFAELKVPITDKINTQISTRWEKYFPDLGAEPKAVMVSGGGIRYQMNSKVAFRATAQQSFSQANPLGPTTQPPTRVTAIPGGFGGGTGDYLTWNVSNQGVRPERGFNYNIGGVFQIGSQVQATVDYYNIFINQVIDPGGLSANTIINAAIVPGTSGIGALLNCSHPIVTQPQPDLDGRAFFQLPAGYTCVQGVTTVNDALRGIQTQDIASSPTAPPFIGQTIVSFFGAQGQERRAYNGGSLETSGVDVNVKWTRPDTFGGDLSLTGDVSYILTYDVGAYQILGIPYTAPYTAIGYANTGSARPGSQRVYPYRASITANFHKGRHNFNWSTRAVGAISGNDSGLIDANNQPGASRNANIGNANGFVDMTCGQQFLVAPPVPTGAGTGIYGQRNVVAGNLVYGYNPCNNTAITSGNKLAAQFNSQFTYRVQLPHEVDLSLTVDNVFDTDPAFTRDGQNWDSSSGAGPLGRTYQISLRKTFR